MPHDFAAEPEITALLHRLRAGQPVDDDARLRLVYEALRVEARRLVDGRSDPPLQPTELAHEVCLRLLLAPDGERAEWKDRAHFLNVAGRAMRNLSIDAARRRSALRRGGGRPAAHDTTVLVGDLRVPPAALAQVREGFEHLRDRHERSAVALELHAFAGWPVAEIAAAQGVSLATAYDDLKYARAVLQRFLDCGPLSGSAASAGA